MEPGWSVRAYKEGDEAGLYKLWEVVHPERPVTREEWMKWWHWMYKENPAGDGLIWLGEADGQIVAQHALVPLKLKVGSKVVLGSWGVDAMTHPDYRRRGLFEAVTRGLSADASKIGITISSGIPNRYSHPGLIKKLGWFEVSPLALAFKPINWKKTVNHKIKNELLAGFLAAGAAFAGDKLLFRNHHAPVKGRPVVTRVDSFDERFDELWARISGQYPVMTVRDKDYLNWRFSTPGKTYLIFAAEDPEQVAGYLVLRERNLNDLRAGFILDMVADSEETMRCLIAEAVTSCRQSGVDLMAYSFIAGADYRRALKNSGFILSPFVKGDRFCVYSNGTQATGALIKDPRNWLVQIADTDTF